MKYFFPIAFVFLACVFNSFCASLHNIRPSCPHVSLENGKTRLRARGRSIKFLCYDGFTLVGNKYSTCVRGEWDTPIPVCVSPNCPIPPKPEHAFEISSYNGSVLIYFCEPSYTLIGDYTIHCNGKQWNSSVPYCRETNAQPPTSCDFESTDLCWWEQDPIHDFDWRRHNFETPSSHIGTGPTFDHTLGRGQAGYYLYIEASGKLVNDTARIMSPLYNSSLTENGCFSFWYHMYGATIGTLNIYFKPETENSSRLMFTKSGEHGDEWLHGIFKLPVVDTNFQIIIEGIRGKSYVSDIAIDDVAILQGDKCNDTSDVAIVTERDDDQVEIVHAMQTCRGKCNDSLLGTPPPSYVTEICYCNIDCVDYSLCCPDYFNYCFNDISTSLMDMTTIPTTKSITSSEAPRNVIPINTTDGIDPYVTQGKNSTTRRTTTAAVDAETPFSGGTQKVALKDEHEDCKSCYDDSNVVMHNTQATQLLRHNVQLGMASIFGIVVGLLAAVGITAIAVFIILHRRTHKRGNSSSALAEDSDVRYLTSPEALNFNLARPSSGDYDEI